MSKVKRMDQIKLILETYLLTRSVKATCRRLNVSKNTVRTYIRRGERSSKDLSKVLQLSDEDLTKIFYSRAIKTGTNRKKVFLDQVEFWVKELRRVGVTRHLLWEEYRQDYPEGYGYSQFCERLKREIGRKDLTLSLHHVPGEVMQVDFAGKKMRWIDPLSGEVIECEVLIAVFPHSQYSFAMALPSQKVGDFIHGLNQALLFFGRLPLIILSDNLKSFVTRADRYDPTFNQLCEQLAAYYQVDLQATRVRKPKDKASVENAVGIIYTRIYAPLRDQLFHSPEQLNEAIRKQLHEHNHKPYQKKQGSRQEIYERYELPKMRDMPSELFEIKKTIKAKVQRNYHVFLGEEKNYYSVPFRYAKCDALVIYTSKIMEIYIDNQRVAIHHRLLFRGRYQYQTNEKHMPANHQEWRKAQGYDGAYFLKEADKIGPATRWVIQQILLSRIHQPQAYSSCKGVLQLSKKYPIHRLEKASLRCQAVDKASYQMIKRILALNLDMESEEPDLFNVPAHDNIRGPQEYQ
ncbi:MAG: IS21 family transposase [Flavobacteriaceae bacterium]|nr:IS21 family transposase [Flavobacteriaceae bacterium]MDH3796337.1 IS21 family transposase [Flavobacteriaceae bacterium]